MNKPPLKRLTVALLTLLLLLPALLFPSTAAAADPRPATASQREHLTPEEIELVRDNQELDKRIAVFIKAAERRFIAVTDPPAAARQAAKETEKWGELKGTRTELLTNLSLILDEAITNIDDAADRSPTSPLLKKSLARLAEAAARFQQPLITLRDASQDEAERDALEGAIERVQEIVEAAKKHPDDMEDTPKGGKKKHGR